MSDPDHVSVSQLPGLHRSSVHRGAVRRAQVGEHRALAVPGDLDVLAGHAGVGKAELPFLAAADDVRTVLQRVRAVRAVVEVQRRRELLRRTRGLLRVAARTARRVGQRGTLASSKGRDRCENHVCG